MKKLRKCDVLELAVWLHETAMKHPLSSEDGSPKPFNDLKPKTRDRYKFVATELLTNPPTFMKAKS